MSSLIISNNNIRSHLYITLSMIFTLFIRRISLHPCYFERCTFSLFTMDGWMDIRAERRMSGWKGRQTDDSFQTSIVLRLYNQPLFFLFCCEKIPLFYKFLHFFLLPIFFFISFKIYLFFSKSSHHSQLNLLPTGLLDQTNFVGESLGNRRQV